MMDALKWVSEVVGKPWVDRADGPDAYDCWGLVIDSFRRIDGIEIEQVDGYLSGSPIEEAGEAEQNSGRWQMIEKPTHGAVFCAYNPLGKLIHVGRVLIIVGSGAGPSCVHARGSNGKGQVAIDTVRVLERFYQNGSVKYFTINKNQQHAAKEESKSMISKVINWFKV